MRGVNTREVNMYAVRSNAGHVVRRFTTREAAEAFVRGQRTSRSPASNFNRYRSLPVDRERGSPIHQYGDVWKAFVGNHWTVPTSVLLDELRGIKAVVQQKKRFDSVKLARMSGVVLPPIEIGVYRDGSGYLIDGNHRLADARRAKLPAIETTFTFGGV